MKPTTTFPTARESAGTNGSHPLRQTLCWALAGFGLGVVAATAYLLLDGEYFWSIPRWAYIVFYPGFFVGDATYKWGLGQEAAKVVGVLAVGFAYAALAGLARIAWSTARNRAAKRSSDRAKSPFSTIRLLALLLLFAAASAQAEGYPVPDHIWVLGLDSHHPVGVAWDNPEWVGMNSFIQVYLAFGMQHPFEMRLPVLVLGLLILGFLSALTLGLVRRFKQLNTGKS